MRGRRGRRTRAKMGERRGEARGVGSVEGLAGWLERETTSSAKRTKVHDGTVSRESGCLPARRGALENRGRGGGGRSGGWRWQKLGERGPDGVRGGRYMVVGMYRGGPYQGSRLDDDLACSGRYVLTWQLGLAALEAAVYTRCCCRCCYSTCYIYTTMVGGRGQEVYQYK